MLAGESNGPEKDKAWGWKSGGDYNDEHQYGLLIEKTVAKKELRNLEADECSVGGRSKL